MTNERMGNSLSDRRTVIALALLVPLFFPKILWGLLPGPFVVERGDAFVFFEPYALEFIRALASDSNPFWSHGSSFGSPTLLTLGTGALHPFHLLHLLLPDWLAFAVGWWMRIAVCGGYIFLYLRQQHVAPWIAIASTISFLFGSFNINYSQEIIGFVMSFFPMMLYYTDRLCRGDTPKATAVAWLSLSTFFVLLGGFPSVVLYLFLTIGFYSLIHTTHWKRLALVCIGCLIGLLAGLPMIVETLAFFPGTGYDPAQRKWLFFYDPPITTALNLVIPSIFGTISEYSAAGMRDFFGSQLGAGVFAIPTLIALSLRLPFSHRHFRQPLPFWLITLFFVLALYFNILDIKTPLSYVPIINEHPFTRLQTLIAFAATLAAALALDQYIKLKPSKTEWSIVMLGVAGIAIAAYIMALLHLDNLVTRRYLLIFGLLSILVFGALAASYLWQSKWTQGFFVLACGAVCLATSWVYVNYYQPRDYYPVSPAVQTIQDNLVSGARVLDVNDTLFRGTAIAYGIPSITNHWFSQPVLREWVQQLSGERSPPGLTLDRIPSIDLQKTLQDLQRMHVQFVVSPRDTSNRLKPDSGAEWRIIDTGDESLELIEILYNGRALTREEGLSGQGYSEFLVEKGDIRLTPQATTLTLPVRYDPGWSSSTPGVFLEKDARHLIQLTIPSDTKQVTLTYLPARLLAAIGIGAAGAVLLIAIALAILGYWPLSRPRTEPSA